MQRYDPWRNASGLTRVRFPASSGLNTPRGHAVMRYKDFRKIFAALYVMRRENIIPACAVAVRGAGNQFDEGRGTRPDRTQGAHNLPRQLLLGGHPLEYWLAASPVDETMALSVVGAEGVAIVLPEEWNKADSLWEMKGLSEAFRAAAEVIVMSGALSAAMAFAAFPAMWSTFHQAAGAALGLAIGSTGPGDQRLTPLHLYQQVHMTEGAQYDDTPPALRGMLGMSFR